MYQYHRPDTKIPVAESVGALAELKEEGKIRHIGVSNFDEAQIRAAQQVTPVVSVQNRYNIGDRASDTVVDLCEQESIVFIPWAPIADADVIVPVRTAAGRHGVTPRQIALAWLLARSPRILPIPGTGSPEHVADNVRAAGIALTPEEVDAISDAVTP